MSCIIAALGARYKVNGKLRDELLNGELLYTLHEAQVLVGRWRRHNNTHRPHSARGIDHRPQGPAWSHRLAYRRERTEPVA